MTSDCYQMRVYNPCNTQDGGLRNISRRLPANDWHKEPQPKPHNMKAVVWRCSVKKVFLEISQNSRENTCARVSFLVAGLRQALTENLRWLLLTVENLLKTCSYVFKSLTSFLFNVSRLNRIAQQNISLFSNQIYLLNDVFIQYFRFNIFASINDVNIN